MNALDKILAQPKVTHDLVQGTPEWDAFRLQHRGASEAAAMLGLSKKVTRTELLHAKHTGIAREFSRFVQERVLDKGHEVEALARPLVEVDLGEDLYPVTCSRGGLSASCDGIDLSDDTAMEHKQWAEDLAAMVATGNVPDEHMPQCQQILLVTGAKRVRFVVSDGTRDRMVWVDVEPDRAWWERIAAGWERFDADLATYQPRDAEPPKPTGRAPETLPALRIEITGAVTASNLADFKATALGAIRSVNRELSTDQQFADAEQAVKWCTEVESRIKAAKEHALSQTATIDELFRTLDDVSAEARKVRLDLEKLVTRRKEEIKGEMVAAAKAVYQRHEDALRQDTGGPWIMLTPPDFGGAIKGKRSVSAMQDALDTTLANAKIVADESARKIRAALHAVEEESKGFEHLFADRLSFISKTPEDVRALVRARITEHQAKLQREAEAAAEKERERIRREEQARADREAREKLEAEQREAASRAAASAPPQPVAAAPIAPPAPVSQAANVVPMPIAQPPADDGARINLSQIKDRLHPIQITAEGLAQLGIQSVGQEKASRLYRASDFPRICAALIAHIQSVQQQRQAA